MIKASVSDIKKIGRPRVDSTLVAVRVPPDLLQALDKYAGDESRPTAIRVLMRRGLVDEGLLPEKL